MASIREWQFKRKFRTNAYGWRASSFAIGRLKEAAAEIRSVAKSDPVAAGDGVVSLMERIWPAFQGIDTSSGALGAAVFRTVNELIPILTVASADHATRSKWLERLFEAVQNDGVEYLAPLEDRWGEIAQYPDLIDEYADRMIGMVRRAWALQLPRPGHAGAIYRAGFQTIRDAFGRAKPNAEYAPLYAAAVARRQADQIYNLSLTRTATVILGRGARGVVGVGRVKTPTLAIVCKRELEIRNFVPQAYFEVVATATVASGQFQMRHAPQERIVRREVAQAVVEAAQDCEGALGVRVEDKRQVPPKLHDLPSLQKLCSSRFSWPASKTLEVAQELYDGQGKKIITYPRAEVRYLPDSLISDVPKIVAGLQAGKSFSAIPVPDPPIIRRAQAAVSMTRDLRAPAITLSFRTSIRSTTCGRSGRVSRSTRRNCST